MNRFAFSLTRFKLSRVAISWVFAHMSFLIPVKRLRETDTLMAFHHPQPSYPLHILLVPKQPIASLLELQAQDSRFLSDLIETVQSLVREYGLGDTGYRLITNGGIYQELPHLHFHLVSGEPAPGSD